MGVNYSLVAPVYHLLEYLVFRKALERARLACCPQLVAYLEQYELPRVLIVGGGDGRFLQSLLGFMPNLKVDYVELSDAMIDEARARVPNRNNVNWVCGSIEDWNGSGYHAVVAQFFLDHYEGGELESMVTDLLSRLSADGGYCVVSDFDPLARWWGSTMVRVMQCFFVLLARERFVEVRRNDASFLMSGCVLQLQKTWYKGWIYSLIWKL